MKFARLYLSLLISVSVMITSACFNPLSDLLGNPTTPSTNPTTDTFNGNLAPNGSLVFTFSVATAGSVAVTLTAVSPATTSPLGLGVGQSSSDGSCTIATSTSGATAGGSPQLSANENPGNYCVKVSDAGSLATTSAVTVTVTHS
jgi:hypothetical protein